MKSASGAGECAAEPHNTMHPATASDGLERSVYVTYSQQQHATLMSSLSQVVKKIIY